MFAQLQCINELTGNCSAMQGNKVNMLRVKWKQKSSGTSEEIIRKAIIDK